VKKSYLILLLLLAGGTLQAQSSKQTKKEEKEQRKLKRISIFKEIEEGENTFNREFSMGGRINTDGWSGFLELAYKKSRTNTNYFQFEFAEKKHPKQDRATNMITTNFGWFNTNPYVYGKQNNFFQAKFGAGQRKLIGGKGNKNGVEVTGIYYGGVSLGLLKPYYLDLMETANDINNRELTKYTPENRDRFLERTLIYGGGGFFKGWGDMEFAPGLHAKTGLRFDWARFNDVISALEVGVNAEIYSKEVPIMVEYDPKRFFFNAYLSLQFGKRWNK
jgi:hypothetical protein